MSPDAAAAAGKDETKSKKKRRKKSMMKKKATQRKSSSSSSVGSAHSDQNDPETDTVSLSTEDSPKTEQADGPIVASVIDNTATSSAPAKSETRRARDMEIHFFSDTELASAKSPSRPSTPIQSDSELEISHRDKTENTDLMSGSASWKWGELPTQGNDQQEATTEDAKQAQRTSMINNIFGFMKQSKKLQKISMEGVYLSDLDTQGMDPEVAAMYFPTLSKTEVGMQNTFAGNNEDDRESGNGTSLPHSPSSMDGLKSLDSDYDDGKVCEK